MTMNTDELQLASACARGDITARRAVFSAYCPHLRRFFGNKVPRGAIEDLINDVFVRLYDRCFSAYTGSGRLRSFVLGVAHRRLLEFYRARSRAGIDDERREPLDTRPSPSRISAQRERRRILCAALRSIPTDAQVLLEFYYWDQLSTGEIAEILARPVGTVRTQIARARELLERTLRSRGFDSSEWLDVSTSGSAP